MTAPTIGDLGMLESISGLSETDEPFVHLRALSADKSVVLIGQLTPAIAAKLALDILRTADAAEFDAALHDVLLARLGNDDEARRRAGLIIREMREHRGRDSTT